MSHVAIIDIVIQSLAALTRGAKVLGLEVDLEARQYRWYGTHVGDYALPAGFSKEDMGHCDVGVIRIPKNGYAYEIGICTRRDGLPGFTLLWDFWAGGHGLEAKVGKNAELLTQAYSQEVVLEQAALEGLTCESSTVTADGTIELELLAPD
jgi:hypothetical protein